MPDPGLYQNVYVRYTESNQDETPPLEASIEYFTDYDGTRRWQPTSLAYHQQKTYTFRHAADSHSFGWYAFSFWPQDPHGKPLTKVIESFGFDSKSRNVYYHSELYVQNMDFDSGLTPSFCVCNNNPTGDKMYIGLQITINAAQQGGYYLTSDDPKIPLLPSGPS